MQRRAPNSLRDWTYEYHYKDQLGNTRLAFRKQDHEVKVATLEPSRLADEQQDFDNIVETRSPDRSYNGNYSSRLNAALNKRLGPFTMLPVQRGDSLSMSAFASYLPESKVGKSWALAAFISSLFNQAAPPPPGAKGYRNGKYTPYIGLALGASIAVLQPEPGVPNAYLKYIVLDRDSQYVYSDVQVIPSAAGQNWQELKLHYKVAQEGFVRVFVYNESEQEVFFDDITIRKDPALIVQENHYDPWGMNLVGIEMQGRPDHKFQYNGKEKQEELGLYWNDYGARFYDPQLGRWHAVDPMTDTQEGWTPYHYVYNNPVLRTDPDGRCPDGDCPGITVGGIIENTIKDLAVSTANVFFMGESPLVIRAQVGQTRAYRDESGVIKIGVRPLATSSREFAANLGSDLLDAANVSTTVTTGGAGGAGLLMVKTGGKAVITNAFVQQGKSGLKGWDKLIGPAGDAGATVTKQIPSDWIMKMSDNKQGTKFLDPKNPSGNHVRVQSGNPNSPNPAQQKPYVKQTWNGKSIDESGKSVDSNSKESHISKEDFKFKK